MLKLSYISLKYLATIALVGALAACSSGSDGDSDPVFDPTFAPRNVEVVAGDSDNSALWNTISWALVSAATDYVVFRSETSGTVSESSDQVVPVQTGDNYLTDGDVLAGETYYYRVQAVSNGETSVLSAQVQGTPQRAITSENLHDVAWDGEDMLVAVGDSGTIIHSPNATEDDWSLAAVNPVEGSGTTMAGVTWDGAQFLAVGAGGTILSSPDGDIWDLVAVPPLLSADLEGVTWTGKRYIAVGGSGTILLSVNGIDWDLLNVVNDTLQGVVSNADLIDNVIVAVGTNGSILSSANDGNTWEDRSPESNNSLNDVTWDGSQFVVVGSNDTILTSPDGIDWTFEAPGSSNIAFIGVTQWDSGLPPAPVTMGAVGSAGNIWLSDDAVDWNRLPSGTTQQLEAMTYVNEDDGLEDPYFVIVGHDGTVLTNQH